VPSQSREREGHLLVRCDMGLAGRVRSRFRAPECTVLFESVAKRSVRNTPRFIELVDFLRVASLVPREAAAKLAPKSCFPEPFQPDHPCPAPLRKIFHFRFSENCASLPASRLARGALLDRHECWRGMRWTRSGRLTCDLESGRPSRVVLISRRWDQASRGTYRGKRRWLTSPVHRGEHEAAVNTIARGMPDRFGCTRGG
jgi:hypothetical protein